MNVSLVLLWLLLTHLDGRTERLKSLQIGVSHGCQHTKNKHSLSIDQRLSFHAILNGYFIINCGLEIFNQLRLH